MLPLSFEIALLHFALLKRKRKQKPTSPQPILQKPVLLAIVQVDHMVTTNDCGLFYGCLQGSITHD